MDADEQQLDQREAVLSRRRVIGSWGDDGSRETGDSLKLWSTAVTQYVCAVVVPGFGIHVRRGRS